MEETNEEVMHGRAIEALSLLKSIAASQPSNMGVYEQAIEQFNLIFGEKQVLIAAGYGIPEKWHSDYLQVFTRETHTRRRKYEQLAVCDARSPVRVWYHGRDGHFAPYTKVEVIGNVGRHLHRPAVDLEYVTDPHPLIQVDHALLVECRRQAAHLLDTPYVFEIRRECDLAVKDLPVPDIMPNHVGTLPPKYVEDVPVRILYALDVEAFNHQRKVA